MKHELKDIKNDFPWTYDRKYDMGWFESIPKGWADVLYPYLEKLTAILNYYKLTDYLYIQQVKEKFGGLRFYYSFWNEDRDFNEKEQKGAELFQSVAWKMESATETVCCDCGATENIECYGGWVHFACPECEAKRQKEWQEACEEWKKMRAQEKGEKVDG